MKGICNSNMLTKYIEEVDKDGDGDFDIVPYYNGDGAYSFTENERFISNLYWENTGGQFVRRELD